MKITPQITVFLIVLIFVFLVPFHSHKPASHRTTFQAQPRYKAPKIPPVPITSDFSIPVLMYHRIGYLQGHEVSNRVTRDLTVSPEQFERQVRFLANNGYIFLTAPEVAQAVRNHAPLPQRGVVITMDDGYSECFNKALPILHKYKARATVFVVTAMIGAPKHLTWKQIRLMQEQGIAFGSHTVHHYDLTILPQAQLDQELRDAKHTLEQELGHPISTFAYPSGAYDSRVIQSVAAAGYTSAWKKSGGPVIPRENPYLLPRIRVNPKPTP